ncbi:hypothetical protein [Neobacillus drentensis]|uniref:hypothetical protein n=1 Tax=Neobacillus drentensis TaxID=220684 RepID=UPI002859BEF5|nr:hypothetical protein [Neobacillus drentensis]MDR7238736.1 hypothetical protein [Neobacillus drentensis]
MNGKNQHQKQKSTREIDPFSKFMFGNRKPRGSNHSQESTEQKGDWLFGRRRKGNENKETQTTQNKLENMMNNVDIEQLFETYDTLKTTTEQYKPVLKGITPFFSKFTNKFKR